MPETLINGRYQLSGKPIGQGGMGVVYKAYDTITKRHVALKSMRGALSPNALELFSKEWSVLAQLSHPNIVDVLDTGEFEQDGERRPFFVMPFLPGVTLDELMEGASPRLTVQRIVGIVSQTCRGLHAAHERGLIHRDLKPSNIFVMNDDAVKIIDFGVVHLVGTESVTGLKGTLQYMSPEQIQMKPCSPASDIFSLGVVCYEAMTGRRPFARESEVKTAEAIRSYIPPPMCDLNPLVTQLVSRVVHKAMAKEPWHRFPTAREFGETLEKALNGEVSERFDGAKIQPRIERAKKAHAGGDYQFAAEILAELEAEGNIDPEMSLLRIQIDQAIRQKSITQLLESARTRMEEDEFPLALQKVRDALEIDPDNPDALTLRNAIEKQRSRRQTENWFRLVEQHLHNGSFGQARQGLEQILKVNPTDTKARELLLDVDRREKEIERARAEKEQLYQSAVNCYQRGEVSSALTKLERILDLTRRSPDGTVPDRDAQYQSLYNQIRTERDAARSAYAEGQQSVADRNFSKALEICNEQLKMRPGDPMFQALKLEAEEQERQEQSAFIAEVSRRAEAERDLDRRASILQEAVERYPGESHLQQSLRLVRERRDLVNSIVERARFYEDRGQFTEALSQFDILRSIYAQYPGIEFETERLKRRRDVQIREESKGRWVEQIDRQIALGDYARARELVRAALGEFPEDRELAGLERLAENALARAAEAQEWLQRGQRLCSDRQFGEGLEALRKAASLDERNAVIRAALLNALLEQARSVLTEDWRSAEPLIDEALRIDAGHPLAKSLQALVLDYRRQDDLNECLSQAREMQAAGDLAGSLAKVEEVLTSYPNEARLVQLRTTLQNLGAVSTTATAPAPPLETSPLPAKPEGPPPAPTDRVEAETRQTVADYTVTISTGGESAAPQSAPAQPVTPPPAIRTPDGARAGIPSTSVPATRKLKRAVASLRGFAEPKGGFSKLQWALIGAAFVILALAMAVTYSRQRQQRAPAPAQSEYAFDLKSNAPNTHYEVDGKPIASLPVRLTAGAHTVEAVAPGYKPSSQTVTAGPGAPGGASFQLAPELVRLRLLSDLKSGQVKLDDLPPSDLQDGNFANEGIALSAEHSVSLTQGRQSLTFSFRAEPGGMVALSGPPTAKEIDAVIIASLGSTARVYASGASLKAGLKDQAPQPVPAEGLEIREIPQNAELTVDDGRSTPRSLPVETGNAPTLAVWLASPNQGTVRLDLRTPDARISIDGGKPAPVLARYLPLEAGAHVLSFTKDSYEKLERKVDIKKGELLTVVVELTPVVRTAFLELERATRGAEVWIDGERRGSVGEDGSFRLDNLTPGTHEIRLTRANYEEKPPFSRAFAVGQTVRLSGEEVRLTPFGMLDFRLTPKNAEITYRRADEAQARQTENGKSVAVRAGRYTIVATANGYGKREEEHVVEPGQTAIIDGTLPPSPPPTPKSATSASKQASTADHFQDSSAWTLDGGWWVHKGAATGWLRSRQGVYVIEFQRRQTRGFIRKTTRSVDWIIDQRDPASRIDYALDFRELQRRATVNGRTDSKTAKLPAAAGSGEGYTLEIDISPERIIVRDAQRKVLDEYQRPNPGEPLGQFGFKGEVGLRIRSGP